MRNFLLGQEWGYIANFLRGAVAHDPVTICNLDLSSIGRGITQQQSAILIHFLFLGGFIENLVVSHQDFFGELLGIELGVIGIC